MIKKYPELTPYEDFTLRDDGGGVYIDVWKSEKPKPSPADLKAWGEDESFQQAKADKYAELDRACREAITNTRFTATIGGVAYDFSYDTEAQGRLKGTPFLLSEGIAPSVPWNAYVNGQRTTVPINLADFKVLAAEAYKHEMKYVIKFREILVYWQTAKTLEDLKAISWN
jgi:hypothetical protein